MNGTSLSVSLLNGQFKAIATHRGQVIGRWERPQPLAEFDGFAGALKEAVAHTGYAGENVALVLAHPRLTRPLVEIPPVKGWNLRWFLERRVRQLKTFDTEAVWSYQPTLPTKNAQAVLLHFFYKPLFDQLVQGCEQAELRLTKVFPCTTILSQHLTALPLAEDEIALLAAETAGTTTVIIGRSDGQIYLGRSLNSSWNVYPDRVNVDLNRTILYVEQQFGATVNSVWLLGQGAQDHLGAVQGAVKVPVKLIPVEPDPDHWNQGLLRLPANDTNNLISGEQQQAPQRRRFLKVTALIIGALALGALATAAAFQALVMDRNRQIEKLLPRIENLAATKGQLQQRETEFLQHKEFVRVVSEQTVKPLAGWFLGYLGDNVPEELLLTQLQFKRADDLWSVRISGALQPTDHPAPATVLTEGAMTLASNLANGPFHLTLADSPADPGGSRTPDRPTPGVQLEKENQFTIQGVIR